MALTYEEVCYAIIFSFSVDFDSFLKKYGWNSLLDFMVRINIFIPTLGLGSQSHKEIYSYIIML